MVERRTETNLLELEFLLSLKSDRKQCVCLVVIVFSTFSMLNMKSQMSGPSSKLTTSLVNISLKF